MVATFAAGLVVLPATASADRVRIRAGGGVRVRAHGHVHIGGPRIRYRPYAYRYRGPYFRPRVRVRYYGRPYSYYPYGYYWGFHYASPPPSCDYECQPSYGRPVVAAAVIAPEPEPLRRFGLGVFGGSVDVEGNDFGSDLGLIGRLRLTRHFALEAEVSKTDINDGARVDKRVGGALLLDLMPYSALSPYLLGGGGFGRAEMDDGNFTANQAYGEVGVGLEWTLGRHFSLFGDLRAGVRKGDENSQADRALLVRSGGDGGASVDDDERFTRARLGALLYF